jgi:Cft2 family RNA processing exonuclease
MDMLVELAPVNPYLIKNLKVDVVYLTHVHWNHWHGHL